MTSWLVTTFGFKIHKNSWETMCYVILILHVSIRLQNCGGAFHSTNQYFRVFWAQQVWQTGRFSGSIVAGRFREFRMVASEWAFCVRRLSKVWDSAGEITSVSLFLLDQMQNNPSHSSSKQSTTVTGLTVLCNEDILADTYALVCACVLLGVGGI